MDGPTWQLLRGDQIVADLIVYGGDFPWVNARLEPKEGFEEIRPIFGDELRLLDAMTRTSRHGSRLTIECAPR
jgi:hypothetical protein